MRPVHVGCSGWQYRDWREQFYPPKLPQRRWLEHYATEFETVEVNSTFYRLAKPEAVARWVAETPPDFIFAVKASRYMTHIKRLADLPESLERYYDAIRPLAESPKLGPVLWQFPANFRRDEDRLNDALARLPEGGTPSSSGTNPGSRRTYATSCARTAPRWSTATTRSARGSRSS